MTRKQPQGDGTWHYVYTGGYIETKQPDGDVYRTPIETFGDMPARTMTEAEYHADTKPFYILDKNGQPTEDLNPGVGAILDRLYRRTFVPAPPPKEEESAPDAAPQEG